MHLPADRPKTGYRWWQESVIQLPGMVDSHPTQALDHARVNQLRRSGIAHTRVTRHFPLSLLVFGRRGEDGGDMSTP
jgi:hypothetical protein